MAVFLLQGKPSRGFTPHLFEKGGRRQPLKKLRLTTYSNFNY